MTNSPILSNDILNKRTNIRLRVLSVEYFLSARGVFHTATLVISHANISRVITCYSSDVPILTKGPFHDSFPGVTGNVCMHLFIKVSLSEQVIGRTFLSITLNTYSSENSKYFFPPGQSEGTAD